MSKLQQVVEKAESLTPSIRAKSIGHRILGKKLYFNVPLNFINVDLYISEKIEGAAFCLTKKQVYISKDAGVTEKSLIQKEFKIVKDYIDDDIVLYGVCPYLPRRAYYDMLPAYIIYTAVSLDGRVASVDQSRLFFKGCLNRHFVDPLFYGRVLTSTMLEKVIKNCCNSLSLYGWGKVDNIVIRIANYFIKENHELFMIKYEQHQESDWPKKFDKFVNETNKEMWR